MENKHPEEGLKDYLLNIESNRQIAVKVASIHRDVTEKFEAYKKSSYEKFFGVN